MKLWTHQNRLSKRRPGMPASHPAKAVELSQFAIPLEASGSVVPERIWRCRPPSTATLVPNAQTESLPTFLQARSGSRQFLLSGLRVRIEPSPPHLLPPAISTSFLRPAQIGLLPPSTGFGNYSDSPSLRRVWS